RLVPPASGENDRADWQRRMMEGVPVELASGERIVLHAAFPYSGSLWFPSLRAAAQSDKAWIREQAERTIAFLPDVDGVVLVADSQDFRIDANVDSLEQACESLREAGHEPARVPFVFQLNKRDVPMAMSVGAMRRALSAPRAAYVESVARVGFGIRRP